MYYTVTLSNDVSRIFLYTNLHHFINQVKIHTKDMIGICCYGLVHTPNFIDVDQISYIDFEKCPILIKYIKTTCQFSLKMYCNKEI